MGLPGGESAVCGATRILNTTSSSSAHKARTTALHPSSCSYNFRLKTDVETIDTYANQGERRKMEN